MSLTAILNVILAVGVIVMVVAPLLWAILTQQRDHSPHATADGATVRPPLPESRQRAPQPRHKPVIGQA